MIIDKIKYTANYNKRFYARLILFQYYKKWYIKAVTLGGILSFLLCIGYLFGWNPIGFRVFPYFCAFYAFLVAVLPFYLNYKTSQSVERNPLFNREIQFEINEDTIKANYDGQEKSIPWNQIFKIENHSKAWLIYGTKYSFFYLPKSTLNSEEQNQIMEWVINSSKFSH
ncbi:MAG TPA: YcxB family protein [Chitinophagales bacterium]|nr:YcxB family protein [Chitinophagales bacterium]